MPDMTNYDQEVGPEPFDEVRFQDALRDRLLDQFSDDDELNGTEYNEEYGELSSVATIESVKTYPEVGMLTMNAGLLVKLSDGTKWALTINQYHGDS